MSEKPFSGPETAHESFGLLQFSRTSSGATNLFGSSIKHGNFIVMRVARASVYRELNQDWYHDRERLIEVEMSQTQFAEAITSMNMGQGVPCTITRVGAARMADCPETSVREQIHDEFQAKMTEITAKLNGDIARVEELLGKKNINQGDRKEILESLNRLQMELGSNIPFIHDQFNEAVDKTVVQAKGEIEAFYTHAVLAAGRQALASPESPQIPQLENRQG